MPDSRDAWSPALGDHVPASPSLDAWSPPLGDHFQATPSLARFWNVLMGGKDNFEADREIARAALKISPYVEDLAYVSHTFKLRAAEALAARGVDQFIDCNPGMQYLTPTHQAVQAKKSQARVLYVSYDPIVLSHARAFLASSSTTAVVAASIFDAEALRDQTKAFLDWSRPIAVIQDGTLPHRTDAAETMQAYVGVLATGSYTVISHWAQPDTKELQQAAHLLENLLAGEFGFAAFRTREQIEGLFPDQELVEPGLVQCSDWPQLASERMKPNWLTESVLGGVGRKI